MKEKLKGIGERIRLARKKQNISQAKLAEMVQISTSHMSDIENGKKIPKLDLFIKITEALQVSSDWLIRSNVPEVNNIYVEELSDLLRDCSQAEKEAYLEILKKLKGTFH